MAIYGGSLPSKWGGGHEWSQTTAGVKTVGLKKAMDRVAAYSMARTKPTLEAAALAGADVAMNWVKESMLEPKSGYKYPHLAVRSSAPGETPAVQTEALINSLNTKNVDSGSPYIGRAVFGAGAESEQGWPYALRLEFGYGRLKARPYMRPAITKNQKEIADAMVGVCDAEWKRLSARVG